MSTERFRMPDRCSRHPWKRSVKRRTRQADWEHGKQYRLVQHECGEECGRKLGWEFHGPRGEFKSGSGECRDGQILRTMELAARYEKHNDRMGVTFGISLTATFMALVPILTFTPWGIICGLSIIAAAAGAMGLMIFTGPQEEMPELDRNTGGENQWEATRGTS